MRCDVIVSFSAPAAGSGGDRESQAGHSTRDELHHTGKLCVRLMWVHTQAYTVGHVYASELVCDRLCIQKHILNVFLLHHCCARHLWIFRRAHCTLSACTGFFWYGF